VPDDIARTVADVLSLALQRPVKLSELLELARIRAAEVSDPVRMLDVLWGAALWVFVTVRKALRMNGLAAPTWPLRSPR